MPQSPQVEPWLLDLLRCPVTGATLKIHEDGDQTRLISTDADQPLAYPVRDGVPVLLADHATPVE